MARAAQAGCRWLHFPRRLEWLFEYETRHARTCHLVAIGLMWIGMTVASAFLFAGRGGAPSPFGMNVAIRLGVVTPFLVVIVAAIWWGVHPMLREGLAMLGCIIAPASLIIGVMLTHTGDQAASRGAITLVLLFITIVLRLRFWFAATACLTLIAVQAGVPFLRDLPVPGSLPLAAVTALITLVANYTLEREDRLSYLQGLRNRMQETQLSEMVDQLRELSHRDALTGLANRRALDAQLEELCGTNTPIAVILVDIDAFKAFNDTYGHQIGDECLRRVAAMMRASLRRTSDRIARIGGEEFVLVLPRTSLQEARITAERMRQAVRELRIPHVSSPAGRVVTISAGVSASAACTSPANLIAEADRALYRAKSHGRNRVEVATPGQDDPRHVPAHLAFT